MKRILITGATGFIGNNLVRHFAKNTNFKVRATYHKKFPKKSPDNVQWIHADLRKEIDVKKAMEDVDIVMHFAATTSGAKDIVSKPYIHVTDNAVMSSLLLREAFEQKVENFIFPSCTIMYQKSEKALKEDDFNPSDDIQQFYFGAGHTKVYLENMCKFFSSIGETKHTVIRHSNLYGPYDKYDLEKSHVTGATITKVMKASEGQDIIVWGTGEEQRDLLYVEDFVDFVEKSLEQKEKFELVNVGLGKGIKIKHLVEKVVELSGKELNITHDLSKPSVPTSLFLNCDRAKKTFGWKPKHSLEEGIKKTLEWYKENENDH